MKRGVGVLTVLVALLVGLVAGYAIGFGVWGVPASQIGRIQTELQRMTHEVLDLKTKLPAPAAPIKRAVGSHDTVASGSTVKR